jgi:hypothetical protein
MGGMERQGVIFIYARVTIVQGMLWRFKVEIILRLVVTMLKLMQFVTLHQWE